MTTPAPSHDPRRRRRVWLLACAAFLVIGGVAGGFAARRSDTSGGIAAPVSVVASSPSGGVDQGCTPARPAPAAVTHRRFEHEGVEREYALAVPEGYDGERRYPLLLDLHGFGHTALDEESMSQAFQLAGERGYVVATPQGAHLRMPPGAPAAVAENPTFAGKPWWNFPGSGGIVFEPSEIAADVDPAVLGADDVAFLEDLVHALESDLCVDARRVFAMGLSNGAGMAAMLACRMGDELAGVGAVAGVNIPEDCAPSTPVSVIAVHGDDDHIVPYDGGVLVGNTVGNPSVPDRMRQWAANDGCDSVPTESSPLAGVAVSTWSGCDDDAEVEMWTLQGVDHGWPLGPDGATPAPLNATTALLDFFDAAGHTR